MELAISEIIEYLEKEKFEPKYKGLEDAYIVGFCALSSLKPKNLVWVKNLDNYDIEVIDENLDLIIVSDKLYSGHKRLNNISVSRPKAAYFSLINKFFAEKPAPFIAPNAVVLSCKIGEGVSIGYNCFIDRDVTVGARTVIRNNVVIQNGVSIGEDCIIESGAIIGSKGFGYYEDNHGQAKKVPDLGGIEIGNRVEIGANTCIERGTLENTVIADDVKIDDLCIIGHNTIIENECMIVAQSFLAGSVKLGKRAYVAPCAAIINQAEIGDNAYIGMGAVVTMNVPENKVVVGVPARVLRDNIPAEYK